MKTRIKIIERADGSAEYTAQVKRRLSAETSLILLFVPIFGWIFLVFDFLYWDDVDVTRNNIDSAKYDIDWIIGLRSAEEGRKKADKIISKKFLKYP